MWGALFAQSGAEYYFEQGNSAYREGSYGEALTWYEKILATGFESSQVYYNMGNCAYKLDQVGEAVLYFERARRLDPHDREIRENLELANQRVQDRIELPPRLFLFEWWDGLTAYFTIADLTRLTAVLYLLTMALIAAWVFWRPERYRRWLTGTAIALVVLTLAASALLYHAVGDRHGTPAAVVMAPFVTVQSAPDPGSTDVFVLHEGVVVELAEERGEWIRIRLPDGKSGWMMREQVAVI